MKISKHWKTAIILSVTTSVFIGAGYLGVHYYKQYKKNKTLTADADTNNFDSDNNKTDKNK